MHPQKHVVIIGAGIIGATSAYQCLNAGLRVTLVEPEPPGDEQAASFGNRVVRLKDGLIESDKKKEFGSQS
jgi:glycine/D-amino acid oxidase-like deaminating enzyme